MNCKKSVLYDNLEFDKSQLRDNEREQQGVPPSNTVMEEYNNNYYWSTENLGRASINALVSIVKGGLI